MYSRLNDLVKKRRPNPGFFPISGDSEGFSQVQIGPHFPAKDGRAAGLLRATATVRSILSSCSTVPRLVNCPPDPQPIELPVE